MIRSATLITVLGIALLPGTICAFQAQQQGSPLENPNMRWESGKKSSKVDPTIRSVQGIVTSPDGKPVEGAVVRLKDTKSLQMRSFITRNDGRYHFQGLSVDIDYELSAEYRGAKSKTRTLSVYNTRRDPVINLQLEAGGDSGPAANPPGDSASPSEAAEKAASKPGK